MSDVSTVTPTLAEVIRVGIEAALCEVHKGKPAKVIGYNADRNEVDLELGFKDVLDTDSREKVVTAYPTLEGVRIRWPGTGAFSLTWPISVGDTGYVTFADRNVGEWMASGESCDPGDRGCHTLAGAVFSPDLRHNQNVTVQVHSTDAVLAAPGLRLGSKDASEPVILGQTFLGSALGPGLDFVLSQMAIQLDALPGGGAHVNNVNAFKSLARLSSKIKAE